jgi:hypothetical protein
MKVIKAPNRHAGDPLESIGYSVFLAGSIEMGAATDWQTRLTNELSDLKITVFNPRRDDWDSTWAQEFSNLQFNYQVNWELDHLEKADLIAMYFDPLTKSPISLLELGLFAQSKKLIVCCPDGFWRKGNVDVVCHKYGIHQVETLEDLSQAIRKAYLYG